MKNTSQLYIFSVALTAIVFLLAMIQFQSLPISTKFYRALIDFGHAPIFAMVAFLSLKLAHACRHNRAVYPVPGDYFSAALLVVVLAVASEMAQLADPGRSVSITDVIRNLTGATLGLLLCAAYYEPSTDSEQRTPRMPYIVPVAVLFICLLVPIMWTVAAYIHRDANWPTILSGKSRLEDVFFVAFRSHIQRFQVPHEWRLDDSEMALHLQLVKDGKSGILVQELDRDWTGYNHICVQITNPENKLLQVTVQSGNAAMFFRSTSFHKVAITIAARARLTQCMPLSARNSRSPSDLRSAATEHRSIAILASDIGENRQFFLHRIWLK